MAFLKICKKFYEAEILQFLNIFLNHSIKKLIFFKSFFGLHAHGSSIGKGGRICCGRVIFNSFLILPSCFFMLFMFLSLNFTFLKGVKSEYRKRAKLKDKHVLKS